MKLQTHSNKDNSAQKPKRVFLADHHNLVRLTIAEWLKQTPDLAVCGQADDAQNALAEIRRLKPDIVVAEMFGREDFRFVQALHKQDPFLPILVFSFGDETWCAPRALEAGADGYLLKGVGAEGLVDGIRRTLEGRVVLSPHMRYQLLMKCAPRRRAPVPLRPNFRRCSLARPGWHAARN